MKKKIILLIISMLLLVGKVDAATLTQRLGDEYISTTIEAGKTVNMEFTSKLGFQFTKWTVEEGSISIDKTAPTINFTMPSSNVTIRGNYDSTYTVSFNNNGGEGSITSITVTAGGSKALPENTFTKAGNTFKGWSKTAGGSVEYADKASIKPNKNITLYAVWEEATASIIPMENIPVGAYIAYNPVYEKDGQQVTSVTVKGTDSGKLASDNITGQDQTFSFSSYTDGWKVLYNDNGKLTLISAESVGSLTLGTKGSVSNDEINVKLNGGKIGYAKAIETLNNMCAEYGKGEFAESGRCLGYNGSSVGNILEYTTEADLDKDGNVDIDDITHTNMRTLLGSTEGYNIIKEPWGDSYNSADVAALEELGGFEDGRWDSWWLASRKLDSFSDNSYFHVRRLDGDGDARGYNDLYYRNSSGYSYSNAYSEGVRPVITLESGLKVVSGDGTTVDTAYVLSR